MFQRPRPILYSNGKLFQNDSDYESLCSADRALGIDLWVFPIGMQPSRAHLVNNTSCRRATLATEALAPVSLPRSPVALQWFSGVSPPPSPFPSAILHRACPQLLLVVDTNKCAHKGHHHRLFTLGIDGRNEDVYLTCLKLVMFIAKSSKKLEKPNCLSQS